MRNLLLSIGYFCLGAGTLAGLAGGSRRQPGVNGLGSGVSNANIGTDPLPGEDLRAQLAVKRGEQILVSQSQHVVRNIDERVSYIKERIEKDSLKPEIVEAARAVVSRKCGTRTGVRWCIDPKDYAAEVKAIYLAVQDAKSPIAVRYVRDHVKVDQFTHANKLLRLRAGDCDDGTILIGSLLQSIGYPVKLRVIQDKGSRTWSHIYLLVGIPPSGDTIWVPLDWSVYPYRPPGWQAPGADQCAATGKPAGIVTRVKDYEV